MANVKQHATYGQSMQSIHKCKYSTQQYKCKQTRWGKKVEDPM